MHDSTVKTLRQLKDTNGRYIFSNSGNLLEGEPDRVDVYPLWVNNDMDEIPTDAQAGREIILFGNMRAYVMRSAGGMNMRRSAERFVDMLQVGFMGFTYLDGKICLLYTSPSPRDS